METPCNELSDTDLCCLSAVVATLDEWMKSEVEVSTDLVCCHWTLEIEFNKSYLCQLSD